MLTALYSVHDVAVSLLCDDDSLPVVLKASSGGYSSQKCFMYSNPHAANAALLSIKVVSAANYVRSKVVRSNQ